MIKKPTILVACASSIATSTIVATCVRDALEENGLEANVTQCAYAELDTRIDMVKPICVLVSGGVKEYGDLPVIVATPLLTGLGKQKVLDQVIQIVKNNAE